MNFNQFTIFINSTATFAHDGGLFVYMIALVVGIWFIASGVFWVVQKGKHGGSHDEKSWGTILMRFFWASCLITLGNLMDLFQSTNGNVDGARQVLAYMASQSKNSAQFGAIYQALSIWCVFIGTIGFFRGFILFDKASQGGHDSGDAFWRGLWHVVFGALAVQIFS